ncbi:GNAT family N-acetyltransferase [Alteribacter natronophilus]|uniref:GNAT family N-acetyltransferase n=1 Tax=Alteribacter natronophilus TaxID=2583810 RepID=UPI00110F0D91|nr:GNAT family N-acetyltransferase [Alteribacter natronophilus]TMW71223.1 GNAT family N-acetyltransferase [Alteribacter natronophilus]
MIQIKAVTNEDVREVSGLIAQLNSSEESHIGYCGKDQKEIQKSLLEDLDDVKFPESFVGAYEGDQLVGVLGFDADLEDRSAEVWGPFIQADKWDAAIDMWKTMMVRLPDEIDSLEMFPNAKNRRACQMAEELSFKKHSDQTILTFHGDQSRELTSTSVEELTPAYESEMIQLHDSAFPGTYYSGQQILERLNENRKVFVITSNGTLYGYIYVEAEPEFGDGNIEFFAVAPSARGKGIGTQLLTGALKWLFTFESIESIRLCVNAANDRAVNLYKKAGFQHQHDLQVFSKEV